MSWKTWAPFQSKEMKDICSHLTKEEMKRISNFGYINGFVVAIFFAIPVSFGLSWAVKSESIIGMAIIILWILIGIPIQLSRIKKGRKLLYSTKWAQQQGYKSDKIY